MIPFRDENPTRTFPFVTVALIAANTIVLLYQIGLPEPAQQALAYRWAAVPAAIVHGVQQVDGLPIGPPGLPLWVTLFTSMFMHGGLAHLLGNMLYLWIFGNNVEDALGHVGYLAFYLLCGLLAMSAQVAVSPDSLIPALGASGAIAGVLGAYLIRFPRARVLTLVFFFLFIQVVRLPAVWLLGFWFVFQLAAGGASLAAPQAGGVAYFAHVGGFIAGMVFMGVFGLFRPPRPRRYYGDYYR